MQKACYVNAVKESDPNCFGETKVVCRNGFLVAIGASAIFAGIIFPLPGLLLDVLLIFSISLTVAVLLIVFSARQIIQVQGFPLLLVMITALRMGLSVASGKMILSAGEAGTITEFFGNLIVRADFVPSILIFGLLAVIIFAVLCKLIRDIVRTGAEFKNAIFANKTSNIDDKLNCGSIGNQQTQTSACSVEPQRREKAAFETCFFTAMTGAAQFVLFAVAIELVVIIFNIVGGLAAGTSFNANPENSTKTYIVLAVGAGMLAYISHFFTILASRYLVLNSPVAPSSITFGAAETTEGFDFSQNRRTVNSSEVQFENKPSSREGGDSINFQTILLESQETANNTPKYFGDREGVFAEFTSLDSSIAKQPPPSGERNEIASDIAQKSPDIKEPGYQSEDYYRSITKLILEEKPTEKSEVPTGATDGAATILMAAENICSLPVTLPVNIAVRLSQQGRKCLLIDLDFEREPITKVFDMNTEDRDNENVVSQSCIENLFVLQAAQQSIYNPSIKGIQEMISVLKSRFDFLIIYAPDIRNIILSEHASNPSAGNHISQQHMAPVIDSAILFDSSEQYQACTPGPDTGQKLRKTSPAGDVLNNFRNLLIEKGCRVIDSADVLAGSI